jgi:hypothetical protein
MKQSVLSFDPITPTIRSPDDIRCARGKTRRTLERKRLHLALRRPESSTTFELRGRVAASWVSGLQRTTSCCARDVSRRKRNVSQVKTYRSAIGRSRACSAIIAQHRAPNHGVTSKQ